MTPELNPSELDALRLKRDIDRLVETQCPREDEFDKFEKQLPRKTKPKKHDRTRKAEDEAGQTGGGY